MLLILINWLLTAYISFTIGFGVRRIFVRPDENANAAANMLWGLFVISVTSTLLLFFTPAGPKLLTLFLVTALLIHLRFKDDIHQSLARLKENFRNRRDKVFAIILLFCLLALSAQSSKINDDGYYYIQTMLWFSDVGFVKGISNLLLPLGLGSSWHILQTVFSFDFIEGLRLNDLNGLLVFIFYVFCMEERTKKDDDTFLVLLLTAALLLSIPFLSAPSPDLPVILLTAMAFYLAWSGLNKPRLTDVLIFAAFAATIKLSAIALILLAVALILFRRRHTRVSTSVLVAIALVAGLAIAKNIYQTGYPFFPYTWFGIPELDWSTPQDVLKYYTAGIKSWPLDGKIYTEPVAQWKPMGLFETIKALWSRTGMKGLINKFMLITFPVILTIIIIPILKSAKARTEIISSVTLVAIFAANFLIWLTFAPQYRFILPVYLFFGTWFLWIVLRQLSSHITNRAMKYAPNTALTLIVLVTVLPLSMNLISTSSYIGKTDGFQPNTILKPHASYRFPGMDTLLVNDQPYFHVQGNAYCWDSPRPCMSAIEHNFLRSLGYELIRESNYQFVLRPK